MALSLKAELRSDSHSWFSWRSCDDGDLIGKDTVPLQRGKGLGMVVALVRPHVGRIVRGGRDDAASLVGVILGLTVTRPALVSIEFDQGIGFVDS